MGKINDFGFPFTSVAGDRQYSAGEWRDYFESLLTNGVVVEILNTLKINPQAVANKTIYIDTGSIVIKGCMRILEATQNVTITDNVSGNPRIDRIVARLNYTDRKIEFAVLTGTPAGSPMAPVLTQNTTVWEILLAQIAVANGFSTIVAGNITDQRTYMQYNVEPYTSDKYFGKYSQMSGGDSKTGSAGAGKIAFTTEDNDDFLAINIGASASRITIPADLNGKKAKFYWFGNGGSGLQNSDLSASVQLYKNNASVQTLAYMAYRGYGSTYGMFQSTPFVLTTGDYFELYAATQTGDYSVFTSISAGSKFGIEVLG